MKKIYSIEVKGIKYFMVREENNTIGALFPMLELARKEGLPYAIAVNNEVLVLGTSLGFMRNVIELEEIK